MSSIVAIDWSTLAGILAVSAGCGLATGVAAWLWIGVRQQP